MKNRSLKTFSINAHMQLYSLITNTYYNYTPYSFQMMYSGNFFEIEMYTSPESWINKLSIDVCFVRIG